MSWWTYINGTITVSPMGRTQAEKRYILDTVLDHLPIVSGSERDMEVYVIQKRGHDCSSSHDELGQRTNNLTDRYGYKTRKRGLLHKQNEYILLINGALRDREFDQTYREFQKWLCRLAKRVEIVNVLVEIKEYDKLAIIRNPKVKREKEWNTIYGQMFEDPTWCKNDKERNEPNWCEYLMWDRAKNSMYPMKLGYKYFKDEENDQEVERRLAYERS